MYPAELLCVMIGEDRFLFSYVCHMGCPDLLLLGVFWGVISKIWILVTEYIGLLHKETIMHRHDHHNTTILSVIHNISTTCSGQYYLAIVGLDTIIGENYTIYNMMQYNHQCWCK